MIYKENPLLTSLVGDVTSKTDKRIEFFGVCDELGCHLMKVRNLIQGYRDATEKFEVEDDLLWLVKTLSTIMSEVAGSKVALEEKELERLYERMESLNVKFEKFTLPGETLLSSDIHIARCVSRRCELAYARLWEEDTEHKFTSKIVFQFLNKISTYLYNLARYFEVMVFDKL